ncbi:hypothetical protein BT96DRAFT_192487 [Gymnopus androsaceus JB14]|uniref:Uncharacterized protein n=1 Tax=Gymnopus androsaceus JB14 TaxID=1447944 RepID=A0A6A4IDP3_9AGAR|nr:hypothetical protein BT96DRAFT_192487 [Gymnopus androsaceus JB14]
MNVASHGERWKENARDTRMKAILRSILNGSSSGELYDALNSSFSNRDLAPARARELAVINYARLLFEKVHDQGRSSKRVLQSIVSATMFRNINTDMSWASNSNADEPQEVETVLRTAPFSRFLRLVEPPKRMRLNSSLQVMRDSFRELLHSNELSAAIITSESHPQYNFICFTIPFYGRYSG